MTQVLVKDIIATVWERCPSAPITTVTHAYINAAREFCQTSRWLRATVAGATIVGQRLYALGSDPYNEILGITAIDITQTADDIHGLTGKSSTEWDTTDANDTPLYYQYVPEASFALHPLADQIYALRVGVVLQPKLGSNSIDDTLLTNWGQTLDRGALARLQGMGGRAWTDKPESQIQLTLFRSECASANHAAAAGYNPGSIPANTLGPRSSGLRTKMQAI